MKLASAFLQREFRFSALERECECDVNLNVNFTRFNASVELNNIRCGKGPAATTGSLLNEKNKS